MNCEFVEVCYLLSCLFKEPAYVLVNVCFSFSHNNNENNSIIIIIIINIIIIISLHTFIRSLLPSLVITCVISVSFLQLPSIRILCV